MDAPTFYLFISLAGLSQQPWFERDPLQRIFALYPDMTLKHTRVELKNYIAVPMPSKEECLRLAEHERARYKKSVVRDGRCQLLAETYSSLPSST